MGAKHSKSSPDFDQERKVLIDDVIKVENELKALKERKHELEEQGKNGTQGGVSGSQATATKLRLGLKGFKWPDPDAGSGAPLSVDDVSRMNGTPVDRIFMVRSAEDVRHVLALARARGGLPVSTRGTQHSMGGHTIAEGGFVIDMAKLDGMTYHEDKATVTLGPGALWSKVVFYLNRYLLSCFFIIGHLAYVCKNM